MNDVPSWIEEVGSSPALNISTAFEIGLTVPEIKHLLALPEDTQDDLMKSRDWIHVPHMNIVIKKIPGITMSLCAFYTGEKFITPMILFNDPYMKDGGQGYRLNANCVTCFNNRDWLGKKNFNKFAALLEKHDQEFRGWINFDVTYFDGILYYQEIRPGLYYDYAVCIAHIMGSTVKDIIDSPAMFDLKYNFTCSSRLYDYMNNIDRLFEEFPGLDKAPYVVDISEAYAVLGEGDTVKKAWARLYERIPDVNNSDLCYRLDGMVFSYNAFKKMRDANLI